MPDYVLHTLVDWWPLDGITLGRHIFIKVKYQGDKLMLAHEIVHVGQMKAHPVWYWVSYFLLLPLFWSPYRVDWEAEAYAVQARAGCPIDGDTGLAAGLSSWKYGWPCRRATAVDAIKRYV